MVRWSSRSAPHRRQQRLEHVVCGADHLRGGLVGLLEAQHVGGFLVQVDAADRLPLGDDLLVDGVLRLQAQAGVARVAAGAGAELGQAVGERAGAAVEQVLFVQRAQNGDS